MTFFSLESTRADVFDLSGRIDGARAMVASARSQG
jgi:hypothetical protein